MANFVRGVAAICDRRTPYPNKFPADIVRRYIRVDEFEQVRSLLRSLPREELNAMHGKTNKIKPSDWPAGYVQLLGVIDDESFVVPPNNKTELLFVASPSSATDRNGQPSAGTPPLQQESA